MQAQQIKADKKERKGSEYMPRGDNPNSKKTLIEITKEHRFKKGQKRTPESIAKQKATRAEKRTFRELVSIALSQVMTDKTGNKITAKEAISMKAVVDAVKGDRFAREFCRDTIGEKPVERVMVAEVSQDVIDEVEKMMEDDKPKKSS